MLTIVYGEVDEAISDPDTYFNHTYSKKCEYSCVVTPQVRQTGNRLSGLVGTAYASLLA